MTLGAVLAVSVVLFALGLCAALARRNAVMVLIGIELMLAAANLNFIAFWRWSDDPSDLTGIMFALFAIAVAAAEAAVGLAIIILVARQRNTVEIDDVRGLRG
jgi:NADH-quinone oxidoreductase subunit K